jgi:arginine-tRNA-protein transferase
MLVQYYYPSSLPANRLDNYLASGWFRNAQMLYKTKLICLDNELYSVVNIRLKIDEYRASKSLRKIIRKNDERFRTIIRPAILDEEKNQLYHAHKNRFEGFIYNSIEQFFYGEEGYMPLFNTYEVCVYDGEKLIAASFFDLGSNSSASLLGLYDQAYSKYSLGIYTMLKEVIYSQEIGSKYYYPGYVLDKETIFDYKLRLGEIQYYNWPTKRWRKWQPREKMVSDADFLKEKIELIQKRLEEVGIANQFYLYPLFSIGYIDYFYTRCPAFIACATDIYAEPYFITEYWMDEKQFVLSKVNIIPFDNNPNIVNISESYFEGVNFFDLLSYEETVIASEDLEVVIERMKDIYDF